jgi:hypothetical protein
MIRQRRMDLWLPTYMRGIVDRRRLRARRRGQLTHVLFLVCDHYEPRHGAQAPDQPAARVRAWHQGYKELQSDCEGRYGLRPVHTWFYPPHHGYEHLPALAQMAFDGLGEVELHYHHSGDTEDTLRANLKKVLVDFRRAGLLLQAGDPPMRRFGFIHGDWALDNSADGEFCGVNSELSLLQELGCWGDLTMPSANRCQTRKINSIYYAVDDPQRPKSHDWGDDARVGVSQPEGLLMIQGPLAVNFRAPRYPRIENASLTSVNWGRPDRIRAWLDCHVHVHGRPEWLFIKLHTHGAIERDFDALFGQKASAMHRVLAQELNDGRRYQLHYVTARQAYNVIKAAEHGMSGDPGQYYDYILGPQATSFYCLDAPHQLECCTRERLVLRDIATGVSATLRLRNPKLRRISGPLSSCTVDEGRSSVRLELHNGSGAAVVQLEGVDPTHIEGATVRNRTNGGVTLVCAGPVSLQY